MKFIKKYPFLVVAVLLAVTAGISWNQARVEARQLALSVEAADIAGTDTTANRANLNTFVNTHSATSASYDLSASYDRDATAAAAVTTAAKATQAQAYAAAQAACTGHTTSIAQAKCNQDYLDTHLQLTPTPAPVPDRSKYLISLHGPLWTTDLTGALLLGSACALALGLIKMRPRRPHR